MSRISPFLGFLVAAIALALSFGCSGPNFLKGLEESRRVAAALRLQFSKAADASNRAVIAGNDEDSVRFVREAEQSVRAIEADVAVLGALLEHLGYQSEMQALARFVSSFAEYRKVDRKILELAVENTNLKARHLSSGTARSRTAGHGGRRPSGWWT